MNKAIILLSGGLDSAVSLATKAKELNIELALIFNYGQKAFEKEYNASKKLADFYNIELKLINLDFLKEITNTSLVANKDVPTLTLENLNEINITQNTMKNVWVPNRNALFINIAASFADSYQFDYIIIGANKEEAETFTDNSKQFIENINTALKTSTNYEVKVLAPLIDLNKQEIVQKAIELEVPLNSINSCYQNTENHCGCCESCNRLKRALQNNGCDKIIQELFG